MVSRFPPHITSGLLMSGGQSFGIGDPVGLFKKFEFDLRRVFDKSIDDKLGYDLMNSTLDAWHLVDWVFAWSKRKADLKDFLVGELQLSRYDRQSFIEAIKRRCPHIAFCQTVCNASKHWEVTKGGANPDLKTASHGSFAAAGRDGYMRTAWSIQDGDRWVAADAVLINVFHFWRNLFLEADLVDIPVETKDFTSWLLWKFPSDGNPYFD